MIRILRYVFLAAIGIVLVTVALANRAPVVLQALPDNMAAFSGFGWRIEVPLFLVIFASIVVGLLIGFVWEWFREHKHRAVASTSSRQVERLEQELAVMRDTKTVPQDDVLALLDDRRGSRKAG